MKEIQLRKINSRNLAEIIQLRVREDQDHFVASNTWSILEAFCAITNGGVALPFGIYDGEIPVGFLMIGYGSDDWEDAPEIARDNYSIWRLMIDARCQHQGYGRSAMAAALAYIRTFPCGKADFCFLSYEPENIAARGLYHSFGFRENGEMDGEEVIAILKL